MFSRHVSSKIFLLFISQHLRKLVTFDLFLFELHMTLLSLRLLFSIHRQNTDHSLGELKTANYIQDCEYYVRTAARKQKYKGEQLKFLQRWKNACTKRKTKKSRMLNSTVNTMNCVICFPIWENIKSSFFQHFQAIFLRRL